MLLVAAVLHFVLLLLAVASVAVLAGLYNAGAICVLLLSVPM